MNKEALRMQKLAGIITEEQYGNKLKTSLESELEKYQKLYKKALRYKHLPKYQEDIEVLRDKIKDTKDAIKTGDFT